MLMKIKLWLLHQWTKFKKFIYVLLVALGVIVPIIVIADDDVLLTWNNATHWTNGDLLEPGDLVSSVIRYQFFNLDDPPVPGGPRNYILLATVPATVTSFAHDNQPNGVHCYVGFHIANNTEISIDSDETCKTIDVRIPGTMTGLSAS